MFNRRSSGFSPSRSKVVMTVGVCHPGGTLSVRNRREFESRCGVIRGYERAGLLRPAGFSVYRSAPCLRLPCYGGNSSRGLVKGTVRRGSV